MHCNCKSLKTANQVVAVVRFDAFDLDVVSVQQSAQCFIDSWCKFPYKDLSRAISKLHWWWHSTFLHYIIVMAKRFSFLLNYALFSVYVCRLFIWCSMLKFISLRSESDACQIWYQRMMTLGAWPYGTFVIWFLWLLLTFPWSPWRIAISSWAL